MVLARLVWMQLRHYPIKVDVRTKTALEVIEHRYDGNCRKGRYGWRAGQEAPTSESAAPVALGDALRSWVASPGDVVLGLAGCQLEMPLDLFFIKANQWLLITTVLCVTLLVRFLTSSWTASSVVATMLLSRGRFLSEIGTISPIFLQQCGAVLWLAAWAHYLRSGARVAAMIASFTSILVAFISGSMVVMSLAMPGLLLLGFSLRKVLARPLIRRFRGHSNEFIEVPSGDHYATPGDTYVQRMGQAVRWFLGTEVPSFVRRPYRRPDYRSGGVFSTLKVPFLIWAYHEKRWKHSFWWGLAVFTGGLCVILLSKIAVSGPDWLLIGSLGAAKFKGPVIHLISSGWLEEWLWTNAQAVDTHYILSLTLLLVCAFIPPSRGLPGYWEAVWLTLFSLLSLALSSMLLDFIDSVLMLAVSSQHRGLTSGLGGSRLPQREFLVWMEPVVLSLAVAGIYNLIEVLDSRESETERALQKVHPNRS